MTTRNFLYVIVIIIMTSFHLACSKTSDQGRSPEKEVREEAPFLDDLLESIKDVSSSHHPLKDQQFALSAKIRTSDWNLQTMERATYKHSPIAVYKCRSKREKDRYLIVFEKGGRRLPAIATVSGTSSLRHFRLSAPDGRVYYEFKVNGENKIGGLKVRENIPFDHITGGEEPSPADMATDEPCPDKTSTFGSCMQCAYGECSDDWMCTVMCGVQFVYCSIGFALACAI